MKIKKEGKIVSLLFLLALVLVAIATISGPLFFHIAYELKLIDTEIQDSDSISFILNSVLSVALGAVTIATAIRNED